LTRAHLTSDSRPDRIVDTMYRVSYP